MTLTLIATIENHVVSGILVDGGSSCDLMYLKILMKLRLSKLDLKPLWGQNSSRVQGLLYESMQMYRSIISFGVRKSKRIVGIFFFVISCELVYNGILGRSFLATLHVVVSPVHLKMKYHNNSNKLVIIADDMRWACLIHEMIMKMFLGTSITSKKKWGRRQVKQST